MVTVFLAAARIHRELPDFLGHPLVGRQQQAGRQIRRAHATGRVDARRQQKRDVIAVDNLAPQSRNVQQRSQANLVRAAGEQIETEFGNHPVLPHQRHHVGERPNRRHLDESGQPALAPRTAAERLHQLERHTDTRQILVRVRAIVTLGIDDREGRRQHGVGLVMIRDDEIDSHVARAPGGVGAADAAVHRHDQVHTVVFQPIDRRRLQTVAVAQAFGDEVHDVRAEQLQRTPQDDRGRDAVHIVVSMDRDAFLCRDRRHDAVHCNLHVGEQQRIVEMIEHRIQEPQRRLGILEAAQTEQARNHRRKIERTGQVIGGGRIAGEGVPAGGDGHHG